MSESTILKGEKAPLLFGHRGCPRLAPENNLSSFQKVLDHNVPGVELDVQICATGELVVYHDNNMKRTTGFDGNIVDHELARIRSLDNGSFFSPEYAGEKIPLLEEVFSLLGSKVYYDIELKADYMENRGMEKKVLDMIRDFHLEKKVIVSSFNPIPLRRFGKLASGIPLFLIYSNTPDLPFYLRRGEGRFLAHVNGIKPDIRLLDEQLFSQFEKKYDLMSWTVDDEEDFRRISRRGIGGICTNRADYFVSGKFVD